MPLASLMEQERISPDLTPILTTAFDNAWAKLKTSGKRACGRWLCTLDARVACQADYRDGAEGRERRQSAR
jgi:hypothetical protein